MKERERKQQEIEQDKVTVEVMVDTLFAAITYPLHQVKYAAIQQARKMTLELKKQHRFVAPLKNRVVEVINEIGELSLNQRNTIDGLVNQFLA